MIISECNISLPFVLFADCEVSYCGRAESSLVRGKYLVVRKVDGSFLIMGGVLVTPLNYQGRGGVLVLEGDVLVCRRLGEVLRVRVFGVEFFRVLSGWGCGSVVLAGSEADLRRRVVGRLGEYFSGVGEVFEEFQTPVGCVDLLVVSVDGVYHVVEFKRRRASLSAGSQVDRYCGYFRGLGLTCVGYVMAPGITDNALKFLVSRGLKFVCVDF